MRVTSVSILYPRPDRPYGGLFVQRRLEALGRRVDLEVVSPQPWFPWVRPMPTIRSIQDETPHVSRPRMFYLPGVLKVLDGLWLRRCLVPELNRLGGERPIDLIDAHFEYPEGVGAVWVARDLNLPVFVTMRGLLSRCLQSGSRRSQCLAALREATGIISVAHSLKQTAEAHGVDGSKIRVVPNAIDAQTFAPGPRTEARARLGVNPAARLIVTVGGLVARKGQHLLVEALARTRSRGVPVRLAIIGNPLFDPTYTRRVRRLVRELGLEAEVDLVGQLPPEQVANWLRAADVFALPTSTEGCCNAILEALACGTPVVTTPVGDNANYVNESCGHIVPFGDVAALSAALDAALGRSWDRDAIAAPLVGRSWDHVAGEVLDFFHERLERSSPPSARRHTALSRRVTFNATSRPIG